MLSGVNTFGTISKWPGPRVGTKVNSSGKNVNWCALPNLSKLALYGSIFTYNPLVGNTFPLASNSTSLKLYLNLSPHL